MADARVRTRHYPIIRVFVSSTFSDLKHERNELQRTVFRELEAHCQSKGFQFQAIDLRWGVPSEAGLDHRTMRICFEELRRSQEISPQPNFLILLGDRYGWRPLPEEISTAEYDKLAAVVANEPAALAVLEHWYRRDDNAVPPVHVLRSRRDSPDGRDYGRDEATREDCAAWKEVQGALWSIINRAFPPQELDRRFDDAHLQASSVPSIVRFQVSATEQEIWNGALQAPDATQHVFAFVRKLSNIEPSLAEAQPKQKLGEFVDLRPDGSWDADARKAQTQLLEALEMRLGANGYYQVTADARLHLDKAKDRFDVSAEHIEALCTAVREKLLQVIDQQMNEYWQPTGAVRSAAAVGDVASAGSLSPQKLRKLELEIAAHQRFGDERAPAGIFVGREVETKRILNYLRGDDSRPLVVYGPSGTGKTALLAHAARLAEIELGLKPIVRYLGTTAHSGSARSLLTSLCLQLRQTLGVAGEPPVEFRDLVDDFYKLLTDHAAEPIYLFLDALDQLDDTDDGRQLGWLRGSAQQSFPDHVRLVVSCLSEVPDDEPSGAPLRNLTARVLTPAGVPIDTLTRPEAMTLLFDRWLGPTAPQASAGQTKSADERPHRTIALTSPESIAQRAYLARCLALSPDKSECLRPLYLKLLYEEARLWRSFDAPPDQVPADVSDLLHKLFRRLRRRDQHGPIVRPALGYIVASRYGLTETEILEVLFADPGYKSHLDQMNERLGHAMPPEAKRIPIALWSRLRFDVQQYLVEREAPGGTVVNFYHRQVGDFVRRWLLDDKPHSRYWRHRRLTRYWLRQHWWLESRAKQRERMRPPYTARLANVRKVTELSGQLFALARESQILGDQADAEKAFRWIERLFQKLPFLEAKSEAGLVFELSADFSRALESLPEIRPGRRIAELLDEALRRDIHFIARHAQDYPQSLFQCLWNSCWWHDCPEADRHYAKAAGEFDSADIDAESPGGRLSSLLVSWRLKKQELSPGLNWLRALRPPPRRLSRGAVAQLRGYWTRAVAISPCGRLLACVGGAKSTLSTEDLCPGAVVWDYFGGGPPRVLDASGLKRGVAFLSDCAQVFVQDDAATNPAAYTIWQALTGDKVADVRLSGTVVALSSASKDVAATALVVTSTEERDFLALESLEKLGRLATYRMPNGPLRCRLGGRNNDVFSSAADSWVSYGFDPRSRVVALGSRKGRFCLLTPDGQVNESEDGLSEIEITCVAVAPGGRYAACGKRDGTVLVRELGGLRVLCEFRNTVHNEDNPYASNEAWAARTIEACEPSTVQTHTTFEQESSRAISSICFFPDGRRLAFGTDDGILFIFDFVKAQEVGRWGGHEGEVTNLSVAPDQSILASVSEGSVSVWDLDRLCINPGLCAATDSVVMATFSEDGWRLATGTFDGTVRVWDVTSGMQIARVQIPAKQLLCVAISFHGRFVAVGSADGHLQVWDLEASKPLIELQLSAVWSLAFSNDESCLAVGTIGAYLLDLRTGKRVDQIPIDQPVLGIAISPDARFLVTAVIKDQPAMGMLGNNAQLQLRVWNRETRKEEPPLTCIARMIMGGFITLRFSLNDRYLICDNSGNVVQFDLASREHVFVYLRANAEPLSRAYGHRYHLRARAYYDLKDTGVTDTDSDKMVAYLSSAAFRITSSPAGSDWATTSGLGFGLYRLEGLKPEEQTTPTGGYVPLLTEEEPIRKDGLPPVGATATSTTTLQGGIGENVQEILANTARLLHDSRADRAIELLRGRNDAAHILRNALGVCLMRAGQIHEAEMLFRQLNLRADGVTLRDDVPPVFHLNYATALLLNGDVRTCEAVLATVPIATPGARRVATAIAQWKNGRTRWDRIRMWFGARTSRPIPFIDRPGELTT